MENFPGPPVQVMTVPPTIFEVSVTLKKLRAPIVSGHITSIGEFILCFVISLNNAAAVIIPDRLSLAILG